MASFKQLYKNLKNGSSFYREYSDGTRWDAIFIGTVDKWNAPDYGKDYIYWNHYGSSANSVSLKNFIWIIQEIFDCKTANEFLKHYKED